MQEVPADQSLYISTVLCSAWTIYASKTDNTLMDDNLILFVLKCAEILFKQDIQPSLQIQSRSRRRCLLADFDWNNVHILNFVNNQDFWVRLLTANINFFDNNRDQLDYHISTQRSQSLDMERDDEGIISRGGRSISPERDSFREENKLIMESALLEVLRWKISAGDDIDRVNKYCKLIQQKFDYKKSSILEIILKVEFRLLDKCKLIPKFERQKSLIVGDECIHLTRVFDYLDCKSGFEFTLTSKSYRTGYKQIHIK